MTVLSALLVEDDPVYARLVMESSREFRVPMRITWVDSMANAVARLEGEESFDVTLLDLGLPESDGLETLEIFRAKFPRMPLVVVSSQGDVETALHAMRLGAQEYLVKGMAEHEVLPRVCRYAIERKRMLDFEQLLVGVVGHDLRGPLQVISLAVTMLRRDETLPPQVQNVVARAGRSARMAQSLVDDLLDLTRLRVGGSLPLNAATADVSTLVRRVVDELQSLHPERSISQVIPDGIEAEVDEKRIEQVTFNLVKNAVQHSPQDAPISVALRREDDTLALEVVNGGPPIAPAVLHTLFEPLTRMGSAGREVAESVGLGLFIVDQIVKGHHGTVDVRSDAETGTTFCVNLPCDA